MVEENPKSCLMKTLLNSSKTGGGKPKELTQFSGPKGLNKTKPIYEWISRKNVLA